MTPGIWFPYALLMPPGIIANYCKLGLTLKRSVACVRRILSLHRPSIMSKSSRRVHDVPDHSTFRSGKAAK